MDSVKVSRKKMDEMLWDWYLVDIDEAVITEATSFMDWVIWSDKESLNQFADSVWAREFNKWCFIAWRCAFILREDLSFWKKYRLFNNSLRGFVVNKVK